MHLYVIFQHLEAYFPCLFVHFWQNNHWSSHKRGSVHLCAPTLSSLRLLFSVLASSMTVSSSAQPFNINTETFIYTMTNGLSAMGNQKYVICHLLQDPSIINISYHEMMSMRLLRILYQPPGSTSNLILEHNVHTA